MRRKLLTLLISFALFTLLTISANAYIPGDTDNDFLVTAADARFALRLSVNLEKCEKESDQYKAADADGDGTVTAADARKILRVSVGLDKFPDHTESNQNIRITKMPYKTNGLVINSITLQDGYFNINVTNKTSRTDMAVAGSSHIPYKMYNSRGDVIESSNAHVAQMNHGESCNVKFRMKEGTQKLVFGSATVNFTEAVTVKETEVISGITVSKAPFTVKGLKVNDISIDTEKRYIYFDVTNNTGAPASGSLKFATYDSNGNSLGTISVSVPSLNAGEKVIVYSYYTTGTTKIIYNDANVYSSDAFAKITDKYEKIDSISAVKMPVTSSGLTFAFKEIKYSSYNEAPTLYIKVTNNTGKAIDGEYSRFYAKAYDSEGYVNSLTGIKIPQLDNGESYIAEISLTAAAAKLDLGNIEIKETSYRNPGKLTDISGISTNATTGSFGGLVISDITVNKRSSYTEISFRITNKTGKAISSLSSFDYKVLSSDNTVITTSYVYTNYNMNNNEYVYKTITIDSTDVGKLYFFLDNIKYGTHINDSASYSTLDGIKITSAPYSSNGLTIESYWITDGYLYLRISNKTGVPVKASSYFNYRIHGTNGAVIRDSSVSCNQMNAGETCEVKLSIPADSAKITFTDAKIYN